MRSSRCVALAAGRERHAQPGGSRAKLTLILTLVGLACSDGIGPERTMPRELLIVSGNAQTTRRGDDLTEPLRVVVIGSKGQPFQGAVIRWDVVEGQGTPDPIQSTTNSDGEADTRITNIATIGEVQVRARIQEPTSGSGAVAATFSITALDPCLIAAARPYALGTVVTGALRPFDCQFSDRTLWDFYTFTLPAQQAVAIRLRSDSIIPPEVGLWDHEGGSLAGTFTTVTEALMKAILAPGIYIIGASSLSVDVAGPYELFAAVTSASADLCQLVFVVRGIATGQQLAPSDCGGPPGPSYDMFSLGLYGDERVIVTQSSTQFGPHLRLVHRRTGTVVAEADGSATGSATIDFTAPSLELYRIHASSALPGQSGPYTLAISYPPGVAPRNATASTRLRVVLGGHR